MDLIIDMREGGDWSLDLCFAGLIKNLGGSKVVDFPVREKHREWGSYHKLPDGSLEYTNWGKERRTLGYVGTDAPSRWTQFDMVDAIHDGVFKRVWLDERMESFQRYRELGLDKTDARVIVVAGHDRFWNHSPQFVASLYGSKLEAMLLDNWYQQYADLPFRTRRIGWSTNFDHYWTRPGTPPEKDIDISFVGYNSHPDRARFIDHILANWSRSHLNLNIVLERQPDTFGQFVSKAEYFDVIGRSRIALNLRGAADRGKTMRAYEIPYVGSFMLSQRIEDPGMMQDFRNGSECMYFENETELDYLIEWALTHVDDREHIAENGHRQAIGPLSVKERWSAVLKWLEEGK